MKELTSLVNSIMEELAQTNIINLCFEHLKADPELEIISIFKELYQDEDYNNVFKNVKKNSFIKTKSRWVEAAVKAYKKNASKNRKELEYEYHTLLTMQSNYGNIRSATESFGLPNMPPEQFIEHIIKFLRDWAVSEDALITSYRYILSKTGKQIEQAIRHDLAYILGKHLLTKKKIIIESPSYTVENPFFTAMRRRLLNGADASVEIEGTHYLMFHYKGSEYDIIVEKEFADLNMNDKKLSDLDQTDFKVFLEVMRHRDARFTRDRVIEVDIGELVRSIYGGYAKKYYEIVENRIWKLKYFSITRVLENTRVAMGIFDYVRLIEHPNGAKTAEIYVNEGIYRDYIERQTIGMYMSQIEQLNLGLSRQLLFVLQKERLSCHSNKTAYKIKLDYKSFAVRIRLTKKRKSENLQDIRDALEELYQQKALVSAYKASGDSFTIEFFPLSDEEVQDFVRGNYTYSPLETEVTEKLVLRP